MEKECEKIWNWEILKNWNIIYNYYFRFINIFLVSVKSFDFQHLMYIIILFEIISCFFV